MAVRIETHTTTKDIAVIEIPQSGKKKLKQINILGALSVLVGFFSIIFATLVIGTIIVKSLGPPMTAGSSVLISLTLMGLLGIGVYLLLMIARYFDSKTDALLKSYGWDGKMSRRIEYID